MTSKPVLISLGALFFLIALLVYVNSINEEPNEIDENLAKEVSGSKQIEIVVQNSNAVKLLLDNGKELYTRPFVVNKPTGKEMKFKLIEGKYAKEIVIPSDFNSERFMCTMDY